MAGCDVAIERHAARIRPSELIRSRIIVRGTLRLQESRHLSKTPSGYWNRTVIASPLRIADTCLTTVAGVAALEVDRGRQTGSRKP